MSRHTAQCNCLNPKQSKTKVCKHSQCNRLVNEFQTSVVHFTDYPIIVKDFSKKIAQRKVDYSSFHAKDLHKFSIQKTPI